MIRCSVNLHLDAPSRLCRPEKTIEFHAMPRTGEWPKLVNDTMGDYFGFQIAEITHREGAILEITLGRLCPVSGMAAAFEEDEPDEYLSSYVQHVETCFNCCESICTISAVRRFAKFPFERAVSKRWCRNLLTIPRRSQMRSVISQNVRPGFCEGTA
jgi:hypothetical protein